MALSHLASRMSPTAKSWLSAMVRALCARLIKDLKDGLKSPHRPDFEPHHADNVRELRRAEQRRRERKADGQVESVQAELDFEDEDRETDEK